MSACGSSRQAAVSRFAELRINESMEERSRDSVVVAVHDTMMETKTITITKNVDGDTLRLTQITDRTRASAMSDVRSKKEDVRVRVDTVYVEKRDSVLSFKFLDSGSSRASSFVSSLKWIFFIIVSLIVLIVVIKFLK